MIMRCSRLLLALGVALLAMTFVMPSAAQDTPNPPLGSQDDGSVIVPSNQVLRPAGTTTALAQRPVDMALSPDGSLLAVVTDKSTLLINAETMEVLANFDRTGRSVAGVAFSPDGSEIYYSIGHGQSIGHATIGENNEVTVQEPIALGDNTFPGALSISPDGSALYVALFGTNSLGIVDLATGETTSVAAGSKPFGAYVTPDGRYVFVSNWAGNLPTEDSATDDSYEDIEIEPETGATASGTVSVYDVEAGEMLADIEVGLHPTAIAFNSVSSRAYVANSNADTVTVIDIAEMEEVEDILVRTDSGLPFGSMPNALAVSSDDSKLFVANGGNNAVAVVDLETNTVEGFIPTEWFPAAVALSPDNGMIYIANNKGQGSRNFLPEFAARSVYAVTGSMTVVPMPSAEELADYTANVDANNQYLAGLASDALLPARPDVAPVPVPERIGEPSVFDHVIYVIKENRTYDQVLGDLEQGNGDPNLTTFGRDVAPNHHTLAERFGIFDNYYTSTVNSADGHQWSNMAMANVFTERVFNYYPQGMYGSSALNLTPNTIYSIVEDAGLTQVNYGENVYMRTLELQADGTYAPTEDVTWTDYYQDYLDKETQQYRFELAYTAPTITQNEQYAYTAFPGWDMKIPDNMRFEIWQEDFNRYVENGNLPDFQVVYFPEDHGSGTAEGFPTPAAHMSDNDLALGRLVEAVSNSPYWENTLIIVIEDDSQDGLDHVDGHRSLAYFISAYSKPGVYSMIYNQPSVIRTIEQVLGLPPMNQFDLIATPVTEVFGTEPDLTPYTALVPEVPLDQVNAPMSTLSGIALNDAIVSANLNWESPDFNRTEVLNAIIWRATRPGEPLPTFEWQGQEELAEAGIINLYITAIDTEVEVEGIVTTEVGALDEGSFYIQDETGGIVVRVSGDTMPEVTVGSRVAVKGTLAIGNDGEFSIQVADAADVTVVEGEPAEVTSALISTENVDMHLGELVRTEATVINTTWYWGDDYLGITSNEDGSTGTIGVYLPGALNTGFATGDSINGETVCITGIVKTFNLAGDYYIYGLAPRSADDLAMGACSQ
jgi:YVTN family beta-propeller protein